MGAHLLEAERSGDPPTTYRLELELYKMYATLGNLHSRFRTIDEVDAWYEGMKERYIPTLVRAQELGMAYRILKTFIGTNQEGPVTVSPPIHLALDRLHDARRALQHGVSRPQFYQPNGEFEMDQFDRMMQQFTEYELETMSGTQYRIGSNDPAAMLIADHLAAMYTLIVPRQEIPRS
jgi:hypothetical protein